MNKLPYAMLQEDSTPLNQQRSGLLSIRTAAGGAQLRDYADIPAASVGVMELGTSFNVAVDPVTGVWAGRDVLGECWLEKWSDTGATKQYWYAPSAAAGVVPSWALKYQLDLTGLVQGDNSTKLCTTSFLKLSGITAAGFTPYAPGDSILASAAGSVCLLNMNDGTFTLPPANSLRRGDIIVCQANGWSGKATVQRSGTDIIYPNGNGVGQTSLTLDYGESVWLMSEGTGYWYSIGPTLAAHSGAWAKSLGASGYQKLPSGLIVQWGTVATSASADVTITFPLAFPTACLAISGNQSGTTGSSSSSLVSFASRTATSTVVGGYTSSTAARVVMNITWMAVGY